MLATLIVLFLFWSPFQQGTVGGQGPTPKPASSEALRQQLFEHRRAAFASGRQLLLQVGVPFDPDELLHDNWIKALQPTFEKMPQMRTVRYESGPLSGVYFADTLYLPERVELADNTVILVRYLVFEGDSPEINGPHDLHMFKMTPVAALGTSLTAALQKAGIVDPDLSNLPSFSRIGGKVAIRPRKVTMDVSAQAPADHNHH